VEQITFPNQEEGEEVEPNPHPAHVVEEVPQDVPVEQEKPQDSGCNFDVAATEDDVDDAGSEDDDDLDRIVGFKYGDTEKSIRNSRFNGWVVNPHGNQQSML
jgi:hypothetical protein